VHRAFRERLGETATQMGSENSPGRFRFDFPNPEPVGTNVLRDVEQYVNAMLIEDLEVHAQLMSQNDAKAMGAMALFGEKYGNEVRVISVGDWAHELCGGTHAQRSGQLGLVTFLSEGSVGAGVRRVEALVGADAYNYMANEHVLLNAVTDLLKVPSDQVLDRIERTIASLKEAEKVIVQHKRAALEADFDQIVGSPEQVGDIAIWVFEAPAGVDAQGLRDLAHKVTSHSTSPAVVVGAARDGDKVMVVVGANAPAIDSGVNSKEILAVALAELDGRGGGKPEFAQGSGTRVNSTHVALDKVRAHFRNA